MISYTTIILFGLIILLVLLIPLYENTLLYNPDKTKVGSQVARVEGFTSGLERHELHLPSNSVNDLTSAGNSTNTQIFETDNTNPLVGQGSCDDIGTYKGYCRTTDSIVERIPLQSNGENMGVNCPDQTIIINPTKCHANRDYEEVKNMYQCSHLDKTRYSDKYGWCRSTGRAIPITRTADGIQAKYDSNMEVELFGSANGFLTCPGNHNGSKNLIELSDCEDPCKYDGPTSTACFNSEFQAVAGANSLSSNGGYNPSRQYNARQMYIRAHQDGFEVMEKVNYLETISQSLKNFKEAIEKLIRTFLRLITGQSHNITEGFSADVSPSQQIMIDTVNVIKTAHGIGPDPTQKVLWQEYIDAWSNIFGNVNNGTLPGINQTITKIADPCVPNDNIADVPLLCYQRAFGRTCHTSGTSYPRNFEDVKFLSKTEEIPSLDEYSSKVTELQTKAITQDTNYETLVKRNDAHKKCFGAGIVERIDRIDKTRLLNGLKLVTYVSNSNSSNTSGQIYSESIVNHINFTSIYVNRVYVLYGFLGFPANTKRIRYYTSYDDRVKFTITGVKWDGVNGHKLYSGSKYSFDYCDRYESKCNQVGFDITIDNTVNHTMHDIRIELFQGGGGGKLILRRILYDNDGNMIDENGAIRSVQVPTSSSGNQLLQRVALPIDTKHLLHQ
jgi:hypothetical protein